MANSERLFVVGPMGSGVTSALNFIEGNYSPRSVVVPKLITAGEVSPLRDPRLSTIMQDAEFDRLKASEAFDVVWTRQKLDIDPLRQVIRHAFLKYPATDTRVRFYDASSSIFKTPVKSVEAFADTGDVLQFNASWEVRSERILRWIPNPDKVEQLMRWHDSKDDEFPLGFRPIETIDTTYTDDDAFHERIVNFIKDRYKIEPQSPGQLAIPGV